MPTVKYRYGATDGFISMPDGSKHYIFGFVDLSGIPDRDIFAFRGRAQLVAPLLDVTVGTKIELTLTNLGMPERPDLDDSHTIHWHGFPNQIPLWDGVPEASISVPVGRDFIYYYKPLGAGTYMYHCHFEPVEHIQMGMIGPLIARPADYDPSVADLKTAYGAGTGTAFDREYFLLLTELDPLAHREVLDAQGFDWTEYRPAYWLINGRSYRDTIREENGGLDAQPYACLIRANAGERVLLRFINLGFEEHAVTILGVPMKIVGRDARLLRGLHGEDLSHFRDVLYLGAGQTADVIISPEKAGVFPLFNRGYHKNNNNGASPGGMMSHVTVYPAGTLPPQGAPGL